MHCLVVFVIQILQRSYGAKCRQFFLSVFNQEGEHTLHSTMETPFPSSAGVIKTAKTFFYTEFIQATKDSASQKSSNNVRKSQGLCNYLVL